MSEFLCRRLVNVAAEQPAGDVAELVRARIGTGDGWVQWQSGWQVWRGGEVVSSPAQDLGRVLAAEFTEGPEASVSIRFTERSWRLWRVSETVGDSHGIVTRSFISQARPRIHPSGEWPNHYYRVAWRQVECDGVGVWTPWVSRFAGWVTT